MEIQDLSRNPRSRTPFSEAAQKDKSGADFSRQTGQQKRRNEKKTKKKRRRTGKQIGGRGEEEKEVERAASRGNWANSR